MKARELVLRILQLRPNLPKTRLVKLCYLVDLAGIELKGAPVSDIPYRWHHYGPYHDMIESAVWDLQDSKEIEITNHRTCEEHDCFLHSAVNATSPEIPGDEEEIIEYIVNQYGDVRSNELVRYVYKTGPMQKAQQENKRFETLDLSSGVRSEEAKATAELAQMILKSEADILNHRTVSLADFIQSW